MKWLLSTNIDIICIIIIISNCLNVDTHLEQGPLWNVSINIHYISWTKPQMMLPLPLRFQKLIYLHVFTDCFMNISPQSLEQIQLFKLCTKLFTEHSVTCDSSTHLIYMLSLPVIPGLNYLHFWLFHFFCFTHHVVIYSWWPASKIPRNSWVTCCLYSQLEAAVWAVKLQHMYNRWFISDNCKQMCWTTNPITHQLEATWHTIFRWCIK